jgi:hypothetical protein
VNLLEREVERHDWAGMRCGCGRSAEHVAADLLRLARSGEASGLSVQTFDGHLYSPAALFEPSVPVVSVILAALADDISVYARTKLVVLLAYLVSGEATAMEPHQEGRDLVEECVAAARDGIWLLYAEMLSGRSVPAASNAYEALELIEEDEDRLAHFHSAAAQFLRWDLR